MWLQALNNQLHTLRWMILASSYYASEQKHSKKNTNFYTFQFLGLF